LLGKRARGWQRPAGQSGHRSGVGDLLIAALAAESGCALWSLETDFARMARLGLITLAAA
jgi:predicted nucleic acid-binding protein